MNQMIIFPVFADMNLASVLQNCDESKDAASRGGAFLFGNTIEYVPLTTAKCTHIAMPGDERAKCKNKLDDVMWNYDVDFAVNDQDPTSNVYTGTGYAPQSTIPFVSLPVIIADCHS